MQNYHHFVSRRLLALACTAALFIVTGCAKQNRGIEFIPGTYPVSAAGYGGTIDMDVTFGSHEILGIDVVSENETKGIGHTAIPKMVESIIASNGIGVDAVTGATITCNALKTGVQKAAVDAKVSDLDRFNSNKKEIKANKRRGRTWDIVVIGAGGAGLAAAAQAAQDGNTVLVIEKNADIGGNTVVSGGVYQSVTPCLVWDPEDPDADTGTGSDGQAHFKVKSVPGCIETLRTILGWSEAPFDTEYYKTHEFVAGDIEDLAERGVHPEYLELLRTLKNEIKEYLDWADRKMADGTPETDLALFSTNSLHIFQSYYGGLRPSNDNLEWCYGDFELVSQFVNESQELRPWLTDMGVEFTDEQAYVVGGLWYRLNRMLGANVTIGGRQKYVSGNLGTYVMAPYSTFLNADRHNTLMTMTTAGDLIFEKGHVRGVEIVGRDGSKDKVFARKGVIIATGGYSANIAKVLETNRYWPEEYLTANIKSTNRASMMGDGIEMAERVGAGVTGMGWTQLMPLSYIDDGQLAFGEVDNSIFVSPKDGRRFVDETSERDVLSFKGFENGIKIEGLPGVYFYIVGNHDLTPLLKLGVDKEMRQYTLPLKDLGVLFQKLGLNTDSDTVIRTIREYDNAIMNGQMPPYVPKQYAITLIGTAGKRPDGTFDRSTYRLDEDSEIILRLVAPATHHTMGGLTVNTRRQVLDGNGNPIDGLFAAGEVTGGIHGGNRLGGNALTEIMVSGRIAAKSAQTAR